MGQGVKIHVETWEITNEESTPVMFQASADEMGGPQADQAVVKALLKQAKKNDVDIVSITLSFDGTGTLGTLMGTVGA